MPSQLSASCTGTNTRPANGHLYTSTIDLLHEYLVYLRCKGRSEQSMRRIRQRVVCLVEGCGWTAIIHISPGAFCAWRCDQDKSAATLNQYQAAINGLLNWLVASGSIESNPLAGVERLRHPRYITHD